MRDDRTTSPPFVIAFTRDHAFGTLAGVTLPGNGAAVDDQVLGRLDARESALARTLSGFRQAEFVGGRLAARVAAQQQGASAWVLLRDPRGAPAAPPGFSASIAHKRHLAVALVSDGDQHLGVDLEDDADAARAIEDVFLDATERDAVAALPSHERDGARLLAFALKEAIYKALSRQFPDLGYADARVVKRGTSDATARVSDPRTGHDIPVECVAEWHDGAVIAAARGRDRSRRGNPSSTSR